MIEIYTQDIENNNFKFITKDINKIINLLRVITYTNDDKDNTVPWNYNGLVIPREMFANNTKKRKIEIHQYEGTLQEIVKEVALEGYRTYGFTYL